MKDRAEPAGDGRYRINGTKIYISAGEHDMSDNIVHLVIARIEGAPEGRQAIAGQPRIQVVLQVVAHVVRRDEEAGTAPAPAPVISLSAPAVGGSAAEISPPSAAPATVPRSWRTAIRPRSPAESEASWRRES